MTVIRQQASNQNRDRDDELLEELRAVSDLVVVDADAPEALREWIAKKAGE